MFFWMVSFFAILINNMSYMCRSCWASRWKAKLTDNLPGTREPLLGLRKTSRTLRNPTALVEKKHVNFTVIQDLKSRNVRVSEIRILVFQWLSSKTRPKNQDFSDFWHDLGFLGDRPRGYSRMKPESSQKHVNSTVTFHWKPREKTAREISQALSPGRSRRSSWANV